MESLNASTLNVVLKIKDGSGFGFLTSPFVITCSLNGNALTTDPLGGSTNASFENEFVWEAEKKFMRSMRSNNYSIRVECFSDTKHKKHDKIGYILLSMKQQAQIVSSFLGSNIIYHWHKLLGVRSDVKSYKPEILLGLFIKEADFELNSKTPKTPTASVQPPDKTEDSDKKDTSDIPVSVNMPIASTNPNNSVQLGSPRDTDYNFKFNVRITSVDNLASCLPPNDSNGQIDLRMEFALFGDCFKTGNLLLKQGRVDNECMLITIKSQVETIAAYFSEFPSLNFLLQASGRTITNASYDMQKLMCRENLEELINERVSVIHSESSVHLIGNASFTVSVAVEPDRINNPINNPIKPFAVAHLTKKVENQDIKEQGNYDIKGMLCKSKNNPTEVELTDNSYITRPDSIVMDIESNKVRNYVNDINSGQFVNSSFNPKQAMDSQIYQQYPLKNLTNIQQFNQAPQSAPQFVYPYLQPMFTNHQDGRGDACEAFSQKNSSILTESVKARVTEELAKKTYEDLEEWKDKQKESYKAELKKKLDKEVKRLTTEWLSRQSELEREAATNIEESVSLSQQLHSTSVELKLKLEAVNKQQAELEKERQELEKKYSEKLRDLREASKKHQSNLQQQIADLKGEIDELKVKNCSLLKENELLRTSQPESGDVKSSNTVQLNRKKSSHLTEQQMTSLLVEMKSLEEKLSAALESKEFFRKEWSRALREIHRMKTEQEEQVRLQLQTQRQELENLRLVGLIAAEEKSSKEDLASLKNLKTQIVRLNTPNSSQ